MYTITFYSYKGGVGRTLALANVASIMAKEGYKPFLWDFDLEAPGLQNNIPFVKREPEIGFLDYIGDYLLLNKDYLAADTSEKPLSLQYPPLEDYLTPIVFDTPTRKVESWLLAAGNRSRGYYEHLANVDWHDFYNAQMGEACIDHIIEQIKELSDRPHYLLVDSRTGYSDVRGICTLQIPQLVVLTMALNYQNIHGIETVINGFGVSPYLKERGKTIDYLLAVSMVPFEDREDKYELLNTVREKFGEPHAVIPYNAAITGKEKLIVDEYPDSFVSKELKNLYEQIIRKDDDNPDGLILRAKDSFMAGRFSDVITLLEGNIRIPKEERYKLAFYLLSQAYKAIESKEKFMKYFAIYSSMNRTDEINHILAGMIDWIKDKNAIKANVPDPLGDLKLSKLKKQTLEFSEKQVKDYKKKLLNRFDIAIPFYVSPIKKIKSKDPTAHLPVNIGPDTPLFHHRGARER